MTPIEHIMRFSTAKTSKLNKICEPLIQYGIDTFWHFTLTHSGYLTYLGNKGEIAEFFYDKKLYENHPFIRAPEYLPTQYYLGNSDRNFTHSQKTLKEKYHLDQIFIIGQIQNNIYNGYAFATTQIGNDLSNMYINNIDILKQFIVSFAENTGVLTKQCELNKVNIASLVGDKYYRPYKNSIDKLNNPDKISFTKQEKICLYWFLRGRSAQQIGIQTSLAKRTVEHYLENIKNKTGCFSKQELFDIFFANKSQMIETLIEEALL